MRGMLSITSAREGASGEVQVAHVLGASGAPVGCRGCAFRVQVVRLSGAGGAHFGCTMRPTPCTCTQIAEHLA